MVSLLKKFFNPLGIPLLLMAACVPAQTPTALTTIDYPGGGKITYGRLAGQSSLSGAMGEILRNIHSHFGDRPQIGNFFQTRGSDSVATFFTLTAKNEGGKQIAGLAMVSMTPGAKPDAAVIYDDAQRFSKTADPMLKKLDEVWHPDGAHTKTPAISKAAAAPLHQTPFPDNSGSVGLPAGWHITSGYEGVVLAEGPNNESIGYGIFIPVMDPSNPQKQQMIQMLTQSGRIPLPGLYVAYPYGGDPVQTLMAIGAQLHQKQHKPIPTFHLIGTQDLGRSSGVHSILIKGDMDQHDGKGTMRFSALMCIYAPQSPGSWSVGLYQALVPISLADQEQATLEAIARTYKVNNAVVEGEAQQNIAATNQIGINAKIRRDASNAAFEEHNRAWERSQDSHDRSSQEWSNYMLGKTVVQDNNRSERGTLWNGVADSLVRNDPQRYQYVEKKDFIKGIDY